LPRPRAIDVEQRPFVCTLSIREQPQLRADAARAEKLRVLPPAATTRWQGTMTGKRVWPIASPTQRASPFAEPDRDLAVIVAGRRYGS